MKLLLLTAVTAALFVTPHAQSIPRSLLSDHGPARKGISNGAVEIPLYMVSVPGGLIPTVNISLGTPPQTYSSLVDSGSSDLWVPDLTSQLCQQPFNASLCNEQGKGQPEYFGGFDPSKSSSLTQLHNTSQFFIEYGDHTRINGSYVEDNAGFDGVSVPNVELAIATYGESELPIYPIWGIAQDNAESNRKQQGKYPQVISKMAEAGVIGCKMFSVWMNGMSGSPYLDGGNPGTIVVGGIDHAKHTGELSSVPMLPSATNQGFYAIPWTSVVIGSYSDTGSNASYSVNVAAILDTGTAAIQLPSALYSSLTSALGIQTPRSNVCFLAEQNVFFKLEFNNDPKARIVVNASDIIKQKVWNGTPVTDNGKPYCESPFEENTDSESAVLGQLFLQAALAIFDVDNQSIGLAQAKINATEKEIVACSGTSGIPGVPTVSTTAAVSSASIGEATGTSGSEPIVTGTTVSAESANPTLPFLTGASGAATPSIVHGAAGSAKQLSVMTGVTVPVIVSGFSVIVGTMVVVL